MRQLTTPEDRRRPPSKRFTDAYGTIFMLILLMLGILLFIVVAGLDAAPDKFFPSWLSILLEQVAGVLLATAILSLFWDVWGRRALAAEVMETADLAHEVREAGLEHVWDRYLSEETWHGRFQRARSVDVFVAYANTWRENNRHAISAFAGRRGTQTRIILPDTKDAATVEAIALRSGKEAPEVIRKVDEAFEKYKSILAGGTNCMILGHKGPQAYAAYRFDDEFIITLYRNSPQKTGFIPTLAISGGTLGRFLREDLDQVVESARVLWSTQ